MADKHTPTADAAPSDTPPPDALSEDQRAVLRAFASGNEESIDNWAELSIAIRSQITKNVHAIASRPTPVLSKAACLAPLLRKRQANGQGSSLRDASPEPSDSVLELVADEHDLTQADQEDFYPAKMAPPDPAYPTWDVLLEDDALDRALESVFSMLDEFDSAPPFTLQRLAELVLEPQRHYHTRSKYLAALRRVLSVTAALGAHADIGVDDDDDDGAPREMLDVRSATILSPIPFLHKAVPSYEEGRSNSLSGIPHGRVDEVDTPRSPGEAHGGVAGEVHPLSAATTVENRPLDTKRLRSEAKLL
ncbi:hypothetical protein MVES_003193 [Malassezia vespertilionis]|uniref:Uncharacterized protein n=1 Tax=Malassezia vespertilionis TaxID=2020962 RepID=A0A2N1J8Q3_9BASI|nr:hypothetical protein MVES_003193 [Malassezia vespertilionis]